MKDQNLTLQVQTRVPMKNSTKKLGRQGLVPAVVYGSQIKNLYLSLKQSIASKYAQSSFDNKILTLMSEDKKLDGLKVLKKETFFHSLTRNPIHIDFLALDMSQAIRVTVEVRFIGKAKGVWESGGVLNILKRSVEVECLPNEIPNFFEIDITELKLNESYHISNLKIPSNIKLVTKSEEALCSVSMIQEEEEKPVSADIKAAEETPEGTPDSKESASAEKDKEKGK